MLYLADHFGSCFFFLSFHIKIYFYKDLSEKNNVKNKIIEMCLIKLLFFSS